MSERDFKGIWIPKEIWLREDLTALDKVILAEIDSLDNENHCIAGNEYFAEFCKCSESKITKTIKKLIELNLIEQTHFDGRHRTLKVVKSTRQSSKKCDKSSKKYEAEPQKVRANNTNNNTINKLFTSKDVNNSQKPIEQEVQSFIDLYHEICTDYPKVKKITDKRKEAILNIIANYKYGDIKTVMYNLQNSDFCKGNNSRGWKADIDFILREDKFISTLEGKYNNPKNNGPNKFGEFEGMSTDGYTEEELGAIRKGQPNGQRTHF